jgi:hypothetical protein
MAQTKRKRKTKHRGNAAGMIETRGRTGRPLSADEKAADAKAKARAQRMDRLNQPPTWRSSANRAAIATLIFAALAATLLHQSIGGALAISVVVFVMYIPIGYYTDLFLYRSRQKKAAGKAKD